MRIFIALILILTVSCNTSVEDQKDNLNGYWEIEKVVFPSGEEKDYTVNPQIDFIELKTDTSGIRMKLTPQIDGSFLGNKDHESFILKIVDNQLIARYRTPFSDWKETILKSSENQLIILNSENIKYYYKRFEKIDTGVEK